MKQLPADSVARVLLAVVLGSGTVASAHRAPANHYLDGFQLAVEHFNAAHERDIEGHGPEHVFMWRLLDEVGKVVPEVAPIGGGDGAAHEGLQILARSIFTGPGSTPEEAAESRKLLAAVEAVVRGCPCDTRTTTESSDRSPGCVEKRETYKLQGAAKKRCATAAAGRLANLDIQEIVVTTDGCSIASSVTVVLRAAKPHDMEHLRLQMEAAPETRSLAQLMKATPSVLPPIGVADFTGRVRLVSSSGKAAFTDPIVLRYSIGWGDCPSGCIHQHSWEIEVVPSRSDPRHQVWSYAVKIRTQAGDPLPAAWP